MVAHGLFLDGGVFCLVISITERDRSPLNSACDWVVVSTMTDSASCEQSKFLGPGAEYGRKAGS